MKESKRLGANKEKLCLNKKELGRRGEDLATAFLIEQGMIIQKRNFRSSKGEIDIIARDADNTIIFVEVRFRTTAIRGYAEESINDQKMTRIQKTAAYYLLEQGYKEWPRLRFDFIAINMHKDKAKFNWIKNISI
jgi:putative endonuclease